MVDDNTKRLVQDSFAQVAPIADAAAAMFYERLFELDSSVKPLFKSDMAVQGRLLMQTIGAAVAGLDDLPALTPIVQDLGVRHARYRRAAGTLRHRGRGAAVDLGPGLGRRVHPGGPDCLGGSLYPAGPGDAGRRRCFPGGEVNAFQPFEAVTYPGRGYFLPLILAILAFLALACNGGDAGPTAAPAPSQPGLTRSEVEEIAQAAVAAMPQPEAEPGLSRSEV